jgi:hypothetical protein
MSSIKKQLNSIYKVKKEEENRGGFTKRMKNVLTNK